MKIAPVFSFKNFIVLAITFMSLVNFVYSSVNFVNFCILHEVGVQLHSFAWGYPIVPASYVEKTILSSLNILAPLLEINWPEM